VPGRDVVASPVLVGRDELLALADRRLRQASGGRGHMLLLSGEAGIGKTRLLASIGTRAERAGFVVARAAAYRGDVETSGGVLLDLASDLRRHVEPTMAAVGAALASRLRDPVAAEGDPHRQRRLLVQDLVDCLSGLESGPRLLVALEDLQWVDALSLEVFGHLAARLPRRACLVVGAYRSDELFAGTPMREWRTRLVSQRLAEEVRLPRLTAAQTAALTGHLLGRPAPSDVVATIHHRTDGIPLHIEELLAAAGDETSAADADLAVGMVGVPESLADAVLARARALEPATRDIAAASAVIGRSFDFDLLTAIVQDAVETVETVDRCLRTLRSTYLIQTGESADSFDFRHALIRDALYADIPLPHRRELHRRVAVVAAHRGYRDAFVSAHFELAGLAPEAYRHAMAAAREAASVSAHREAMQLYQRALRNLSRERSAAEHAGLLAELATEAAAIDENAQAADAFAMARQVWVTAGDLLSAAAVVPAQVAVAHLLGEGLHARVRRLEKAMADIEGLPDAGPVMARLLSAVAAAYLVNDGLDEAIMYGERSRALSRLTGDDEAGLNTAATLGSVLLFAGQTESGWTLLEGAITRSVELYLETEAARAYRLAGSSGSALVEYDRAEHWLVRGLAYADTAQLWNHRNYMAAHLAHVRWARGEWASAQQTAERALADGRGGITTRNTALYVLGYLALGRGELVEATGLLREALELGESMAELQRISPPLWGLAEAALRQGDLSSAISLCERGFDASHRVGDSAYLFPYLVTGMRAHLGCGDHEAAQDWLARSEKGLARRAIPGTLPAVDHASGLLQLATGNRRAAADSLRRAGAGWQSRQRFWEGSWAALDLVRAVEPTGPADESARLVAATRSAAERAGAALLVAAADELPRPTAPSAARPQPWHPLTAREYSVANLVSTGKTNREIADELYLSPKTVSAHVEHILSKLGAGRRTEIAAWAARVDA
jgi:DNA-binding CsgD family transcriptional regulator/tetratricopeptide (TPR) repeat protein